MKMLSVIVPVYYNEESLPLLMDALERVEADLRNMCVCLELIFVDDGSGDNSLAELMKIKSNRPNTKVVKLTRNFGAIQAIKSGVEYVTGDCFMYLAADLQDPPHLIVDMVKRWKRGQRYVICVREGREDPFFSKCMAAVYYKIIRLLVIKGFPSGGYDLALMDKAMLSHIRNSGKNINLSLYGFWLGYKPDIIYYRRRERVFGASRWTLMKKLKYFSDSVLGFSIAPLRLISFFGIAVSILSFFYGAFVIVDALVNEREVPGFYALAALIAFLLGVVIAMLGVIGEYLWRIFEQTSDRPEAVVEKVYQ